jgi:hypothetical protein
MIFKMRENMTSYYRGARKVLSLFVAICLVLGMPLRSVFAAEYDYPGAAPRGDETDELTALGSGSEIIAFAEIDSVIFVPLGTLEPELPLPGRLTATVPLPEKETSSDSGDREIDMDVPVTWQAVDSYDSGVPRRVQFFGRN